MKTFLFSLALVVLVASDVSANGVAAVRVRRTPIRSAFVAVTTRPVAVVAPVVAAPVVAVRQRIVAPIVVPQVQAFAVPSCGVQQLVIPGNSAAFFAY
jgi:uncharacterized protein (DUF58 family)